MFSATKIFKGGNKMVRDETKSLIVNAIQTGLWSSAQNRVDRNLSFNNNIWNDNLNYIFDSVMKLDGKNGLTCFQFNRSGFHLVSIFDKESKTLFSICSERKLNTLLNRETVDTIHYTDSLCQLSSDANKLIQMKMDIIPDGEDKLESINELLEKITSNFEYRDQVERYCILETTINHNQMVLYAIRGVYLTKEYSISEIDESWNDYIQVVYGDTFSGVSFVEQDSENQDSEDYQVSDLSIKQQISLEEQEKE